MARPTKAEQAAKAAAKAADEAAKKQAEHQAAESTEPTQTDAIPGCEPTQTDATPEIPTSESAAEETPAAEPAAEETPAEDQQPSLEGKMCADCKRGKREEYHGLDSVRCPLRPFLQRAWQQACPDFQL